MKLFNNILSGTLLVMNFITISSQMKETLSEYADAPQNKQENRNHVNYLDEQMVRFLIDNAPEKLKELIEAIKDRKHNGERKFPAVITLLGKTGTGKTVMAEAIAQELNIPYVIAVGSLLQDKYYEYSIEGRLVSHVNEMRAQKEDFAIVILDDIEGCINQNIDPMLRAGCMFGTLIDEASARGDILFIVTANNIDQLPSMLKSRMSPAIINFDLPDQRQKEKALAFYMIDHIKTGAIAPMDIVAMAKYCKNCSYRALEGLVMDTDNALRIDKKITIEFIKKSVKKYTY